MEKKMIIQRLWNLCNLMEDYCSTGLKSVHPGLAGIPGTHEVVRENQPVDTQPGTTSVSPGDTRQDTGAGIPREKQLALIREEITGCTQCSLHFNRTYAVPGEGILNAGCFIVGNRPAAEEDTEGKPFTGRVGEYLNKWLAAIQITLSGDCFTCHIVRCRPPKDRDPHIAECRVCFPYLDKQITIVQPRTILCLGRIPAQILTGKLTTSVEKLRGQPFSYKGIPLVVTYHPASVLKNQELRKPVWEDLKRLKTIITKRTV